MFPFDIQLITFCRNYFFKCKLFLIFFAIISHKTSKRSSATGSSITYVHGTVFLFFYDHKNFFQAIWSLTYHKKLFILNSYIVTTFKFRIFVIIPFIKVNTCAWFYFNRLHFNGCMLCIITFTLYTFLDMEVKCLYTLRFNTIQDGGGLNDRPQVFPL